MSKDLHPQIELVARMSAAFLDSIRAFLPPGMTPNVVIVPPGVTNATMLIGFTTPEDLIENLKLLAADKGADCGTINRNGVRETVQ